MATGFTYIPATKEGYTLQKGDALTHRVHESEAIDDALSIRDIIADDDFLEANLDELIETMEQSGEMEDYVSAVIDALDDLMEGR